MTVRRRCRPLDLLITVIRIVNVVIKLYRSESSTPHNCLCRNRAQYRYIVHRINGNRHTGGITSQLAIISGEFEIIAPVKIIGWSVRPGLSGTGKCSMRRIRVDGICQIGSFKIIRTDRHRQRDILRSAHLLRKCIRRLIVQSDTYCYRYRSTLRTCRIPYVIPYRIDSLEEEIWCVGNTGTSERGSIQRTVRRHFGDVIR